jgi:adenylate cyclase
METKWSTASRKAGNSLAVLYFQNVSGSKQDEYFRDGVTEDIIIELSRIRGLSMLSLSAVRAYRDKNAGALAVGAELGASFVLDGTLRRARNRLRLSVELVEVKTGHTVWAERYDRKMEDVFSIQDEIAHNIADRMKVMLSDSEKRAIAKVPTTRVEAYDAYLQGRQNFRQFRRKSIEFARRMFEHAIEIDPEYAGAYAGLADCDSYLYMFWDASEVNLQAADAASRNAVELDDDLAEAHVARGLAVSLAGRHEDAEREFRRAIELDPTLFEAYYFFARDYYAHGKLDRAVYWFQKACEARPEDYQAPTLLGSALRGLGLKAKSDEAYRNSVERGLQHLEVHPGETRALYFGAVALSQLGERKEQALEWAERALAMDPEEPQVLYNVACVYALQGLPEKAIDCLARTLPHGDLWRGWMANDPDLASLHDRADFQELARSGD